MLQHRHGLTGLGVPHDNGAVRGAADQVAAARAEAAAVDPVGVTAQGRVGELREVDRAVDTDGLVAGGGGQQARGEGAAGHLVRVIPKGGGQRRHLATGGGECGDPLASWCEGDRQTQTDRRPGDSSVWRRPSE